MNQTREMKIAQRLALKAAYALVVADLARRWHAAIMDGRRQDQQTIDDAREIVQREAANLEAGN